MQVNLKVLAGPYKGSVFNFSQPDTFLIGRTEDSHLCLPNDRFFSRHHCLLEINPPRSFLRDLGSTNGTFVNGERVREAFLKNGDRIQGGETLLQVEVTTADPHQQAETTQDAMPSRPVIVMVECIGRGAHNGVVYLVTEVVDGPDASKLAEAHGGDLSCNVAISIISQALDGLGHAHPQGYIHRDFKDQNILVTGEWPHLTAKL